MEHATHYKSIGSTRKQERRESLLRSLWEGIMFIYMFFSVVIISIGGFLLYLLDFAFIKSFALFVYPRILVYLSGQYLTLLHPYLVIALVFLPTKYSFPIVLVSSLASLFIVLMV